MPESGWTRRAALLHLAGAAVLGQAVPPVPAPRPTHPRLILPDADLPRIQALLRENGPARRQVAELRREAERLLHGAPPDGHAFPRVPGDGRRILDRVYLFGLLYRLEHETSHLAWAVRELSALAASPEWNAAHIFETAEMTLALAVGYDWLWPELKPEERDLVRGAIINKGLKAALPWYEKQTGWATTPGLANVVGNAGLGFGALAVAGDEPELSASILKYALESMARSFAAGPEGSWIEAHGAWTPAPYYAASLLAALESSGAAYDPVLLRGLERAAHYRVYATGPMGRAFAVTAGAEPPGEAPEMFWLARRLRQPALAWSEQRELTRRSRAEALDLVWLPRDAAPPQAPAWPLDALFPAQQHAQFRSSWEDDAIFLAVKGTESKPWRGHPDAGSFVLDALGVRWALGAERSGGPPNPPRTPNGAEAHPAGWHNTLSLSLEPQEAADARFAGHEFTPGAAWVALDLTRLYGPKLKLWRRRIGILQRQAVMVEDQVRAAEPVDVIWSMLTDAEVSFGGQSALLTKEGASLVAEILTPRHAVFDVLPAGPNRRLVATLGEKTVDVDLSILLTPYKTGQPKPKITARFAG